MELGSYSKNEALGRLDRLSRIAEGRAGILEHMVKVSVDNAKKLLEDIQKFQQPTSQN